MSTDMTLNRAAAPMSVFERYLTVWVLLCIVTGIALGQFMPGVFQAVGRLEIARVNLPVGILIWVMIIPMLMKVDFGALHEVRQHVRGIGRVIVAGRARGERIAVVGQPAPCVGRDRRHRIADRVDAGRQVEPVVVRNAVAARGFVQVAAVRDACVRHDG